MICKLCLKDILEVINIFDEIGIQLDVAAIIKKYFWFEPKNDDPTSKAICHDCWLRVFNFHEFYLSVEKAHRLLDEKLIVDVEGKIEKEEVENSSDDDVMPWDVEEVNLSYSLLDEEEKPEECELSNNAGMVVEAIIDDTKEDVKDVDIKPPTAEVVLNTSERVLSLRTRSISHVKHSSDTSSTQTKTKQKCQKKSSSTESKYLQRAKEHDELIAKHMKLTCVLCRKELIDFASLRQHFLDTHEQKGYVVCCNKKIFKRILLVHHIKKHLDPEHYKCQSCNKVFASDHSLRNHKVLIHPPEKDKLFQCKDCPKRFSKGYLLKQHQVMHVPIEERKFSCELCQKLFPSENTLSTHRKNTHFHEHDRMCQICAKVIRGKAMFEKHQLEHNGIKQPEIQCEKCGSWLKSKHSLQKHMRRHNEDGKMHTCSLCGKTAPNDIALRSHIRYVHAPVKTFECSFCDKSFKKSICLKEHMTTHTGEILYSCSHCPKTFNSNSNLYSHRKKVHTKEWEANRKNRKDKVVGRSNAAVEKNTDNTHGMLKDETQNVEQNE